MNDAKYFPVLFVIKKRKRYERDKKWYMQDQALYFEKTFLGTTKNRLIVGHGSDGTGGPRRPPGPSKRNMEKICSIRVVNAFLSIGLSLLSPSLSLLLSLYILLSFFALFLFFLLFSSILNDLV